MTTTSTAPADWHHTLDLALTLPVGTTVRFTAAGAPIVGTFEGAVRITNGRRVTGLRITVRTGPVRRAYDVRDIAGLTAAPEAAAAAGSLAGLLPECATFVGAGARCAECRVLHRNHA